MARILITGGAGFIGSHVADAHLARGDQVLIVDDLSHGRRENVVERTDLRVAVPEAVFEVSEAKRWLLGGYNHGHVANVPYPIAMEMALGFRFTAERCIGTILVSVTDQASRPVAQYPVAPSLNPKWDGETLAPAAVVLRCFVVADGDGWRNAADSVDTRFAAAASESSPTSSPPRAASCAAT